MGENWDMRGKKAWERHGNSNEHQFSFSVPWVTFTFSSVLWCFFFIQSDVQLQQDTAEQLRVKSQGPKGGRLKMLIFCCVWFEVITISLTAPWSVIRDLWKRKDDKSSFLGTSWDGLLNSEFIKSIWNILTYTYVHTVIYVFWTSFHDLRWILRQLLPTYTDSSRRRPCLIFSLTL